MEVSIQGRKGKPSSVQLTRRRPKPYLVSLGLTSFVGVEARRYKWAPTDGRRQLQIILLATSKGRKAAHPPAFGS